MEAETETINGTRYFTVKGFAKATNRSEQNVRFLICYGNRIRRLLTERIAGRPMIPCSELTEFPFTAAGRNSKEVYHYSDSGVVGVATVGDSAPAKGAKRRRATGGKDGL